MSVTGLRGFTGPDGAGMPAGFAARGPGAAGPLDEGAVAEQLREPLTHILQLRSPVSAPQSCAHVRDELVELVAHVVFLCLAHAR